MTNRTASSVTPGPAKPPAPGERRLGIVYAIACFTLWGFLPLYWKLLDHVDPREIFLHRMIWACLFMLIVARIIGLRIVPLFTDKRRLTYLAIAGVMISATWAIYIWAVVTEQVVEISLGYFIQPLFMVAGGVFIFKEKLTRMQIVALILAFIGVSHLTLELGGLPLIALALAVLFAAYGFIKKKAGYDSVESMVVETSALFIPAIIGLIALPFFTEPHFLADPTSVESWKDTFLLMLSGIMTLIPLLLFARAANLALMSTIGFLSYLEPTFTLILGIFVFHEPFSTAHLICFGLIWIGIVLIFLEGFLNRRVKCSSRHRM